MTTLLAGILLLTSLGQWEQWQCLGDPVTGRYFNYAEGFSVAIPQHLPGRHGRSAGPERGVSVPLSDDCAGAVVVYGEPNSLDWRCPSDAISDEVEAELKDD